MHEPLECLEKNVTSLVTSKVWKEQKKATCLLSSYVAALIRACKAASCWTTRYLSFKNFLGAIPTIKFALDNSQVSTVEMESLQEVEVKLDSWINVKNVNFRKISRLKVMINELFNLKKPSSYILSQMMKFVAKIINLHKCKLGISGLVLKYYIFQV